MQGFYIAIGQQGEGKTAFITKLLVNEFDKNPNIKVFSNYKLLKIPYQKISFEKSDDPDTIIILDQLEKDPNFFNNSIMLLDEIHLYLDSLDFMRKNNRKLQTFFSQLRKRNILLLATTQYFMNVDIRIRRHCKNAFEMTHIYKDLFQVVTNKVDGYLYEEVSRYNIILSDYYDHYDTNELILE